MVKGPTTQISPLKTRSKNYIGFTSASEAGFTTSKATGTGLKKPKGASSIINLRKRKINCAYVQYQSSFLQMNLKASRRL